VYKEGAEETVGRKEKQVAKMEGSDVLSHASLLMIVLQACTAPIRLVQYMYGNIVRH